MALKPITEIKAAPLRGGCVTVREKTQLPNGGFSMVQNLRPKHPGFIKRLGQRKLHSTADGSNKVLSLYQFKKSRQDEEYFFAQMSDGDVLQATNPPPTVTTGVFGSSVFSSADGSSQIPASWINFQDMMLYADGVDQHQVYAGSTTYIKEFIVYKGDAAIPTVPELGERYGDQVTDGQSATVAILDSLNTFANHNCLFIATPFPAKSFTFTIPTTNSNTSTASIYYWNGSWSVASNFNDTTSSGNKTFTNASGTMSFDMPEDILTKFQYGLCRWWYQIRFDGALDSSVRISSVTCDADWQDIVNVWNGATLDPAEVRVEATNSYYTYSAAAIDLDELSSGKKIMVSISDPTEAFYVDVGATPASGTANISDIKYYDGNSFETVGSISDGTDGFGNSGWITFPRNSDIQPSHFQSSQLYSYWYEITFDDALVEDTAVGIEAVPYYDIEEFGKSLCSCAWKNRMVYTFDQWSEYLYITAANDPFGLNGSEYGILETGDGRANDIVAMKKFHNELMVWQEEKGVEGGTLTLFQGYSPTTFGKLLLSSKVGTMSNKTVAIVDGVMTSTATEEILKTLAFFLSRYGVCASDGRVVSIISDDIQNYFDPTKDECIRRGYEKEMFLKHDSTYNLLRIGLVSGDSAETPNVFLAFDLTDKVWLFDDLAQELSCMVEVESGSGNTTITQVGGGVDDGYVYQLNYGTNDVTTTINSYIDIELNGAGEYINLRELLLRAKAQTSGEITLIVYKNGIEHSVRHLTMTPEISDQLVRRHRIGLNVTDQHISVRIQNNEKDKSMYLEDLGIKLSVWEGR